LALGKGLAEIRAWPAAELEEWKIFCEYERLPDYYWIGAQTCAVVANSQRASGPALKIEDFLPIVRPSRPQSEEEMRSVLRGVLDRQRMKEGI
jgi:hypothetical protein